MKHMAQFLLFVYSLIIFLSLFVGEAAFERTETRMRKLLSHHFKFFKILSPYFITF